MHVGFNSMAGVNTLKLPAKSYISKLKLSNVINQQRAGRFYIESQSIGVLRHVQ